MLKKVMKLMQADTKETQQEKPKNYELHKLALTTGLFDQKWYEKKIGKEFEEPLEAFNDYLYRSRFTTISPSKHFDNEFYIRAYDDVYRTSMSPLRHYLLHGRTENRRTIPEQDRWIPKSIVEIPTKLSDQADSLNVAIMVHIYYKDFIKKFSKAIAKLPIRVDVLCTAVGKKVQKKALETFAELPNVNEVQCVCVKNHGRNFGPLLVEFSKKLLEYDLFCHLHSKKSLFSGRENTQWADYLTEYLLLNEDVVTSVLNAFVENKEYGIYYPVPFPYLPGWVNHILKNKANMLELSEKYAFDITTEFLAYPVGGMFWARPAAIEQLLSSDFVYDDFPKEPIPNDGTILHGIERSLGLLAKKNKYKQLFYVPDGNYFTEDSGFITYIYQKDSLTQLRETLLNTTATSFDLFDTLLTREYYVPDSAKMQLGAILQRDGLVSDANEFVILRNKAEFELRKKMNFRGDVNIYEIYEQIGLLLQLDPEKTRKLADTEFELDFAMIVGKDEMIDLFNELIDNKKMVSVVSDTYYTIDQITLMLRKAGGMCDCRFYISSNERMRKDTGQLWSVILKEVTQHGALATYVHVGDNVVSDCQIPGDLGIRTYHILSPIDKCVMMGLSQILQRISFKDERNIVKWGTLITKIGRNPFVS